MRKIITGLAFLACVFLTLPAYGAQPDTSAADTLAFPHFPVVMHDEDYWQNLASRFVSPGWFHARLAEKTDNPSGKGRVYGRGIKVNSPECLYEDSQITPHVDKILGMLAKSASLGWAKSATLLARKYRYGTSLPNDEKRCLHYLWRGATGGDSEAFFTLAFDAFAGTYGAPKTPRPGIYTPPLAHACEPPMTVFCWRFKSAGTAG